MNWHVQTIPADREVLRRFVPPESDTNSPTFLRIITAPAEVA